MSDIALHVDQQRTPGLIGASDAAAILGLSQYDSPLSVYRELRGEPRKERPAFVQEAAEWGQALEPIVRAKYALAKPAIVSVPLSSVTLGGWLRCTPDGYVMEYAPGIRGGGEVDTWASHDGKRPSHADGLLQVKTCSAYLADDWKNGPPPAYEVQCRVEMAVCDLPWNDIICLVGGQRLVGPYRIHRDMAIEARILADLYSFWQRVQRGEEPDPDASAQWQEYAASKMRPSKVVLKADADTLAAVKELRMAKKAAKVAKSRADAAMTSLLLALSAAGATAVESEGKRILTAYQTGGRTDYKGWAASLTLDEPPAEFVKPSTTWAIKLMGDDE